MARVIPSSLINAYGPATAGRSIMCGNDQHGRQYPYILDERAALRIAQNSASVVVFSNNEARDLIKSVIPNLDLEGTYHDKFRSAQAFIATGRPIEVGMLGVATAKDQVFHHRDGQTQTFASTCPSFGDGRHRTKALVDAGVDFIPVVVNHDYFHRSASYHELPKRHIPIMTRISDAIAAWGTGEPIKHFGTMRSPWQEQTKHDGPERMVSYVQQLGSQPNQKVPPFRIHVL